MKKITWDELEIIESEVEFLMEEDSSFTKEEAFESASSDDSLFEREWESFIEYLTELMSEVKNYSGYWMVNGKNMGWRNRTGQKLVEAEDGKKLISEILPEVQFTLRGKKYYNRIELVVSHHDSPTGETYIVKPISYATYERGL